MDRLPRLVIAFNIFVLIAMLSASNIYYSVYDDYSFFGPLIIAACNASSVVTIRLLGNKPTQNASH
jgi:hypothetical protein